MAAHREAVHSEIGHAHVILVLLFFATINMHLSGGWVHYLTVHHCWLQFRSFVVVLLLAETRLLSVSAFALLLILYLL
jgi:hypothetical protein